MRKLAVFVEGFTELIFLERLISEIARYHNIFFEKRRIIGGSNMPRKVISITTERLTSSNKFYVLLFDCGGDHQVKPRVVEDHQSLTRAGFSKIIGLRDVRPNFTRNDIPQLERNLRFGIKTSLIPVDIFLATMEIEAWFLAESTHFTKIDSTLHIEKIEHMLGFNPEIQDMSLREEPASDIQNIYSIVNKKYIKPAKETIDSIDYSKMYLEISEKIPSLGKIIKIIDDFYYKNTNLNMYHI